jgi:hypothetical protein
MGPFGPVGQRGEKGERGERGEKGNTGVLPLVKAYEPGKVHYEGDVVTYDGSTYQASRDTAQSPPGSDWRRLAEAGRDGSTPTIRGTYSAEESYKKFDVVALNGSSFIARKDNPANCPGPDWQLIASAGKPGRPGPVGAKGEAGPRGERGQPGPGIIKWKIDRAEFTVCAIMSDGSEGQPLDLRELFEQFQIETR